MPRKTAAELQSEEQAAASPLRRSTRTTAGRRLSTDSESSIPQKVTRSRRASQDEIAPTEAKPATRLRRVSSLLEEKESSDSDVKKRTPRQTAKKEPETATKPATRRRSSVSSETEEVKASVTTRKRRTSTDSVEKNDLKEEEPVRRSTRARRPSVEKEEEQTEPKTPKLATRSRRRLSVTENVTKMEAIEEQTRETSPIKEEPPTESQNLSVVKEEEDAPPKKSPKLDKKPEKETAANISEGSDGSFRFELNVSVPSVEEAILNDSKASSNNSDKENSPIKNIKEGVDVFKPKLRDHSFFEPMEVDMTINQSLVNLDETQIVATKEIRSRLSLRKSSDKSLVLQMEKFKNGGSDSEMEELKIDGEGENLGMDDVIDAGEVEVNRDSIEIEKSKEEDNAGKELQVDLVKMAIIDKMAGNKGSSESSIESSEKSSSDLIDLTEEKESQVENREEIVGKESPIKQRASSGIFSADEELNTSMETRSAAKKRASLSPLDKKEDRAPRCSPEKALSPKKRISFGEMNENGVELEEKVEESPRTRLSLRNKSLISPEKEEELKETAESPEIESPKSLKRVSSGIIAEFEEDEELESVKTRVSMNKRNSISPAVQRKEIAESPKEELIEKLVKTPVSVKKRVSLTPVMDKSVKETPEKCPEEKEKSLKSKSPSRGSEKRISFRKESLSNNKNDENQLEEEEFTVSEREKSIKRYSLPKEVEKRTSLKRESLTKSKEDEKDSEEEVSEEELAGEVEEQSSAKRESLSKGKEDKEDSVGEVFEEEIANTTKEKSLTEKKSTLKSQERVSLPTDGADQQKSPKNQNEQLEKEDSTKEKPVLVNISPQASAKLDKLLENLLDSDSEDDEDANLSHPAHEYIDDICEEGEEDTPSEDSNEIIDEGESIHSTDSEEREKDDEEYEKDSFICDDEVQELLSGDEYDLDDGEEKGKRKSRIIQIDEDCEDKIIVIPRKKKEEETVVKKGKILHRPVDESDDEVVQIVPETEPKIKIIENITITPTEEEEVKEIVEEEETAKRRSNSKRKSSISILENIKVEDLKEADIGERISDIVEKFVHNKSTGEICMNLSLELAEPLSDDCEIAESKALPKERKRKSDESVEKSPAIKKRKSNEIESQNETKVKRRSMSESRDEIIPNSELLKERRLSRSVEKLPIKKKSKKKKKVVDDLRVGTLNMFDQLINEEKRNRPVRQINPTKKLDDLSKWRIEKLDMKPSTSSITTEEKELFKRVDRKFHAKDFRNQMIYDSKRVKRVETKKLLSKKGAF